MNETILSKVCSVHKAGITVLFLLVWMAGCSAGPAQSPETFIMGFIEKHISMIDLSLSNYYVKKEQSLIKEMVTRSIESKKENGTLDSLKQAVYDFSKINVTVLSQKEKYIDDEAANFVKVETKGSYTLTMDGKTQSIDEDEIFILQAVGDEWKVTEKVNPWN
jgi:hypothetical protein